MLTVPEYDLDKESTLTVLREDDVISPGEAKWFRKELERLAGKTLTGQPRLRMVWGPTHHDPMSTDPDAIKYLDINHRGVQLGERRWFIEIHRTPEFLARSGRYQLDTIQDEDGTKLLKSLPSEGCYDYWMRLERGIVNNEQVTLVYQPPDNEALAKVKEIWEWEQLPQNERDALEDANRELGRRQIIGEQRQRGGAIYTGAVPHHLIPR